MAEQKLPTPATSTEMFTHAAVLELRKLNKNIEALTDTVNRAFFPPEEPVPVIEDVELREPEQKSDKPPHRDAKQAAAKVADEAVGPVTVATTDPKSGKESVEVVQPSKDK